MQRLCLCQKSFLRLGLFRILLARVCRAHGRAHRIVVESDAFGAFLGHYIMKILRKSGQCLTVEFIIFAAGVNRRIRAFGLASTTIDAFFDDLKGHCLKSSNKYLVLNFLLPCEF